MKRLLVRWSSAAARDLIEIVDYIRQDRIRQDRPSAARKMGRAIVREVGLLAQNPSRGNVVPELRDQQISDYRQFVIAPYRVIYGVRADSVNVEAIIDSRRDLQNALLQRLLR